MHAEIDKDLKDYGDELLEDELNNQLTGDDKQPKLPQIRVRYTNDAHMLLPGKFGNHFDGKVANPGEILLFKRVLKR